MDTYKWPANLIVNYKCRVVIGTDNCLVRYYDSVDVIFDRRSGLKRIGQIPSAEKIGVRVLLLLVSINSWLLNETSVTRLGKFWNLVTTYLLTKLAQKFGDFLGNLKMYCLSTHHVGLGKLFRGNLATFIISSGHTDWNIVVTDKR